MASELHERCGTAYLSLCADSAIPEMDEVAGCRIVDRAPARDSCILRFIEPWGCLEPGDVLQIPAAPETLITRGVRLEASDGRVVAIDPDGYPALVVASRGRGHTVTCAEPIELLLARIPDAHRRYPDWWRLYGGLAELSGAREPAWADHPDVTTGVLHGVRGGLVTLTNHGRIGVEVDVHLPDGAATRLVQTDGTRELDGRTVHLEAGGAAIVVWEDARG